MKDAAAIAAPVEVVEGVIRRTKSNASISGPPTGSCRKPLGGLVGHLSRRSQRAGDMKQTNFPPGWDEERVRRVLEHYERQSDDEAVAEDEAAYESTTHTAMEVPVDLVRPFANFSLNGAPGSGAEVAARRLTPRWSRRRSELTLSAPRLIAVTLSRLSCSALPEGVYPSESRP